MGSCRPPGHSEDVVLQGPEAVVDNSVDNVLELALAQPWSRLGSFHFSVLVSA